MTINVGKYLAHESAHLHVSGKATYIDDIPEPAGILHAAVGLSDIAHGQLRKMDLDAVSNYPGVVTVLTAAEIEHNNCGPIIADDPILAAETIQFHGQAIFAVVATTRAAARAAVRLAKIEYESLPALLNIDAAVAQESWVLPPVEISRGDVESTIASAPHQLSGTVRQGGQEHFYLEGQVSLAEPREDNTMHVWCSTQHPTEMQHMVAHALGWSAHQVSVACRRMGGGFGGKESQSAQWACIAALLANKTGKPVKLRLDRDEDMRATGKRHEFLSHWEAGFDNQGMILGIRFELASQCGYSADLSGPVNDRAICHVDNAYYLDAVHIRNLRCKTNTVSNTAFRGFGGPQGMLVIETAMEDIARYLGRDPLEIREINFYAKQAGQGRDTTPYQMTVEDNVIHDIVHSLSKDCQYHERRDAIAEYNASNPVIKRGISLTPLKFGISFNATIYNQASALVHVYTDGTVLVSHGGTEMGQGLYTKIRQIVADEFGLPSDQVRLSATDTTRVPNTSATAASSGTDINGKAAQAAAIKIRNRLIQHLVDTTGCSAESVTFADGRVRTSESANYDESFATLAMQAYRNRIQLWDSGFYKTPKIYFDPVTKLGRPFFYFAYGAACSEVAIDTLTGESRVLRVDIRHDVGHSINPALDIGQIEGGFIQGMGWLTSEELWWKPDGKLMTHAPSTYKIPTATDIPEIFNVTLHDNTNVEDTIHRSKAVGEPPLMLAFSVFFAIRNAIASTLPDDAKINLDAPATPESILRSLGEMA